MRKFSLFVLTLLIFQEFDSQVFNLKSMPANLKISRKEGGSLINIDVRNSMPMNHQMTVGYSLNGVNADAMVNTDLESFSQVNSGVITFNNNDTIVRFSFKPVLDGINEGNDTFFFRLDTALTMGSIGTPDSVMIIISDSTASTISGRPLYDIGKIRGNNAKGVPDSVAKSCSIRGVLYGINRRTTGYEMFICDGTGCIGMYSTKTYSLYPNAKEGDSVEISGYIGENAGFGRIQFSASGDTIRLLGTGVLKNPTAISTALNESTESKLIKIDGLTLKSGKWVPDSNFNLLMKNSANVEYTVRVLNNPSTNFSSITTTIDTTGVYSITGMGSQFDLASSGDKTSGYQVYPRKLGDIVKTGNNNGGGTGSISSNQTNEWTVFPTIVSHFMHIQYNATSKDIAQVDIIDLQGKIIKTMPLNINTGNQVYTLENLESLPQGNYVLSFTANQARFSKPFSIVR